MLAARRLGIHPLWRAAGGGAIRRVPSTSFWVTSVTTSAPGLVGGEDQARCGLWAGPCEGADGDRGSESEPLGVVPVCLGMLREVSVPWVKIHGSSCHE